MDLDKFVISKDHGPWVNKQEGIRQSLGSSTEGSKKCDPEAVYSNGLCVECEAEKFIS